MLAITFSFNVRTIRFFNSGVAAGSVPGQKQDLRILRVIRLPAGRSAVGVSQFLIQGEQHLEEHCFNASPTRQQPTDHARSLVPGGHVTANWRQTQKSRTSFFLITTKNLQ